VTPNASRPSVPTQREPSLSERLRWTFGWIVPTDLTGRSETELLDLAERWAKHPRRVWRALEEFASRATSDPRLLQKFGDLSRGIEAHDTAVASYLRAAEIYMARDLHTKSASLLQQLVMQYPDSLEAQVGLGRSYEAMGRTKESAIAYAKASQLMRARGNAAGAAELLARADELAPYRGSGVSNSPPKGTVSNPPPKVPTNPPPKHSAPAPAPAPPPVAAAPAFVPLGMEPPTLDDDEPPEPEPEAPTFENADATIAMPHVRRAAEAATSRPLPEPKPAPPGRGLHASLLAAGEMQTRMYAQADAAPAQDAIDVELAKIPSTDTEPDARLPKKK